MAGLLGETLALRAEKPPSISDRVPTDTHPPERASSQTRTSSKACWQPDGYPPKRAGYYREAPGLLTGGPETMDKAEVLVRRGG